MQVPVLQLARFLPNGKHHCTLRTRLPHMQGLSDHGRKAEKPARSIPVVSLVYEVFALRLHRLHDGSGNVGMIANAFNLMETGSQVTAESAPDCMCDEHLDIYM